jgi:hypothetical protein
MRGTGEIVWVGALALAATSGCRTLATEGVSGPPKASSAPPASSSGSDAASGASLRDPAADAATPAPLGPLRWGTRPDPNAPLAVVLDGYCVGADVDFVGDSTFVHSGRYAATLALATEDGLTKWEELEPPVGDGYGTITELGGAWPDGLWMAMDDGARAWESHRAFLYEKGAWIEPWGPPSKTNLNVLSPVSFGGGLVAITVTHPHPEQFPDGSPPATFRVVGRGVTPPVLTGDGFEPQRLFALPSGELLAIGNRCGDDFHCNVEARRAAPGAKPVTQVLIPDGNAFYDSVNFAARSATEGWLAVGAKLFRFDGARFFALPAPPGPEEGRVVRLAPDGAVWAVGTLKVFRTTDGSRWADVSPPKPLFSAWNGPRSLDGVEVGAPWAALADGTLVRWDTSAPTAEGAARWTRVSMPKSPFAHPGSKNNVPRAEGVRVRNAKDVWVNAKYVEWPSHWYAQVYEERRMLLRTLAPKETLRCRERGSRWPDLRLRGFESWPPAATAECKTPLVLLGAVEPETKTDWPQLRAFLKGKKGLEGTRFVQFAVGGRKWLAARPPTFEVGSKLLAMMGKGVPYSAGEMVCADPENAESVPIDLVTGKLIAADAGP